ncbi:KDO2-lipid IV(A) lauroyltransferase [Thermodesulfobium acidiphilum]|uniref:KDO2-lipid IV(A) lauroyltransferase n=1 Tax=Thermodesulfobium acidiphilum TaxID=1794699 RepID=A0A2R4W1B5_THEAF|nr:KDO2-lipid IV(A) lauroyltransferase [Thermodesulfobium acidiphilum]
MFRQRTSGLKSKIINFLIFCIDKIPDRLSNTFASICGRLLYFLLPRSRELILKNLSLVFPEWSDKKKRDLAVKNLSHYVLNLIELVKARNKDITEIMKNVEVIGLENFSEVLKERKSFVVASAHIGNWELLATMSIGLKIPIAIVVKEQVRDIIDRLFSFLRLTKGIILVEKENSLREGLKILKTGKLFALLSDQDAGKNGIFIDFFGIKASTYPGAAYFAYRGNVSMFTAFTFRKENNEHCLIIEPEIKIDRSLPRDEWILQAMTEVVRRTERMIKLHPEQWLWCQKRFKTLPNKEVNKELYG